MDQVHSLQQIVAEYKNSIKVPSCLPICIEEIQGGRSIESFRQIILDLTKSKRVPIRPVVTSIADLECISRKTAVLNEVFNLFDSRGMGRIDMFEVLTALAMATQSTLDDKIQILFVLFSFEGLDPVLNKNQFMFFMDTFIRAMFKVVLKEGESFYPTHQNRRLSFREIQNIGNEVFKGGPMMKMNSEEFSN